MQEVEDKSRMKAIYWLLAIAPMIFINLLPYIGVDLPTSIDNDEVFYQLALGFSLAFIFFLVGIFACYKCITLSKIIPAKIVAGLFLFLYVVIVLAMMYFFFSGYLSN